MGCEHKRVKSVNCKFYCIDCGVELRYPTKEELFPGAKEVTIPPLKAKKTAKKGEVKNG